MLDARSLVLCLRSPVSHQAENSSHGSLRVEDGVENLLANVLGESDAPEIAACRAQPAALKIPEFLFLELKQAFREEPSVKIGRATKMFPALILSEELRSVHLRKHEFSKGARAETEKFSENRFIVFTRECQHLMNESQVMLRQNPKASLRIFMDPSLRIKRARFPDDVRANQDRCGRARQVEAVHDHMPTSLAAWNNCARNGKPIARD